MSAPAPTRTVPAQVFLRPIGNPLPLGFVGLAVATAVLSSFNLGWIPTSQQHQVAIVLIAFPFPLQLVATILLFLARDAPAGAGNGVLSVTWLVLGLLLLTSHPGSLSPTLSIFLFASAAALLPSACTASLSKLVPGLVFTGSALKYVLTGLYERFGGVTWEHATGWEGIVLAALAIYAALASDLAAMLHRSILPLGRHGGGLQAVDESVADQEPELEREPGVRSQT